ncbi:MAG: cyclic nucleotide-binding domain-containing protein, partial [Phycisphaeraceae bacterium]
MAESTTAIDRPQRWDVPFGPEMTERDVHWLLSIEPFKSIDPHKFPASTPLEGILHNDTRIVKYKSGDLIVREGDYGHSAFLILEGKVRVVLENLPPSVLGRQERRRKGFFESLAQWWRNPSLPEVRSVKKYQSARTGGATAQRAAGDGTRIFLQDIPAIIGKHKTVELKEGTFFGELAALGRIPRAATVFADGDCEMLEIRWQGLRDIRRRDEAVKKHIDALYRKNALQTFLLESELFNHLNETQLKEVADATEFETYGGFEWYATYKTVAQQSAADRLAQEPVISSEGDYPNG